MPHPGSRDAVAPLRTASPRERGRLLPAALLRACRPRQWSKNLLVLAAPAAGGRDRSAAVAAQVAGAFVAFCMLSSATYLLNDVRDLEQDRPHPRKRLRPIASGELSPVRAALGSRRCWRRWPRPGARGATGPMFGVLGCGYLALTGQLFAVAATRRRRRHARDRRRVRAARGRRRRRDRRRPVALVPARHVVRRGLRRRRQAPRRAATAGAARAAHARDAAPLLDEQPLRARARRSPPPARSSPTPRGPSRGPRTGRGTGLRSLPVVLWLARYAVARPRRRRRGAGGADPARPGPARADAAWTALFLGGVYVGR